MKPVWLRHSLAAILAACMFALAFDIAGYPLLDPDEGRNAEIAREMSEAGDFLIPRLNGLPYVDKPVLYFAAVAAAMKLMGPTVLAARIPSLLFTLATLVVVAWFARRLFGGDAAWIAAIVTAATPFSLAYARTVIFDSALTFFVVVALAAFYLSVEARRERPEDGTPQRNASAWWTTLAWAAMACGVLTKGPVALVLPLLVAVPFAAWQRRWRALADPVAILVFVSIVFPWVVLMRREVPDILEYALVTETASRMFTDELQRTGPVWYFLALLPAAALPWSVVGAAGWPRIAGMRDPAGKLDRRALFLLLWIVLPLAFFTLSQSKRPQYILPLMPAIGLIVAAACTRDRERVPGSRGGAIALAIVSLFLLAAQGFIPTIVSATPPIAAAIPGTARMLGLACAVGGLAAWLFPARRAVVLAGLTLPVVAIPFVSRSLMDEIGRERSAIEIARAMEPQLTAATEIVAVGAYPLSLPFYLRRTLVLSTADGTELTSNYLSSRFELWSRRSPTLRTADWWRDAVVTCNRPRVFVFDSHDWESRRFVDGQLTLLIDNGRYAAYGPCGMVDLAAERP